MRTFLAGRGGRNAGMRLVGPSRSRRRPNSTRPPTSSLNRISKYTRAGDESLKLDLFRPKEWQWAVPRGGVHPRRRIPGGQPLWLPAVFVPSSPSRAMPRMTIEYRLAAEAPVSGGDPGLQIGDPLGAGERREVSLRRESDRRYRRFRQGGHLVQFLGVTADVKEFDPARRGINRGDLCGSTSTVQATSPSPTARAWTPPKCYRCGSAADLTKERLKHIKASPLYWVTPNAAPTLCIHGTEDKYVGARAGGVDRGIS